VKYLVIISIVFILILIGGYKKSNFSFVHVNEKYPTAPEKRDFTNNNFNVTMYIYDDLESLQQGIKKYPDSDKDVIRLGLAVWNNKGDCEIHVVEPSTSDDINTWGHELMHCVYGNWH